MSTSTDLHGKTAIVTGASRGIGLAVAQALATAGANVVLTSRKQEAADRRPREHRPEPAIGQRGIANAWRGDPALARQPIGNDAHRLSLP